VTTYRQLCTNYAGFQSGDESNTSCVCYLTTSGLDARRSACQASSRPQSMFPPSPRSARHTAVICRPSNPAQTMEPRLFRRCRSCLECSAGETKSHARHADFLREILKRFYTILIFTNLFLRLCSARFSFSRLCNAPSVQ